MTATPTAAESAAREPRPTAGAARPVRFTEAMRGFVGFGETDFERGVARGGDTRTDVMFHLTIELADIDRFLADGRHEAAARGWVRCEALGGTLPVQRGVFHLFVDGGAPRRKRMLYRLHFRDGLARPLTLTGFKTIQPGSPLRIWPDTSTLYTRVLRGHVAADEDERAAVIASGILRIRKRDFARQLTTFRAGGPTAGARLAALARFGGAFCRDLWGVYGVARGRRG